MSGFVFIFAPMQNDYAKMVGESLKNFANGLDGIERLVSAIKSQLPDDKKAELEEHMKKQDFDGKVAKAKKEFQKVKSKLNDITSFTG